MDHIAIMSTKHDLIGAILSSKKTIESRWYKTKRAPWDKVKKEEWVYFKESGGLVIARAQVEKVLQFDYLTIAKAHQIIEQYGKEILIQDSEVEQWAAGKKYCILIFLKNPETLLPFSIVKTGFGNAAAWLVMDDIRTRKVYA